nr:tyrosine-type recombinase/integrase [uncultured Bacteroides sp.]
MEIQVTSRNESKTVKAALGDFIFHCKYEKGLSKKTMMAYHIDLSQLEKYLIEKFSIEQIEMVSKDMIKSYLQNIASYKYKTIKRKIASMKAFFSFYEFENETFINPLRKLKIRLKEPQILPTVMCFNEVKMILRFLYQERIKNKQLDSYTYKSQTRNIAIIELLFATGIRVSELCQLQYKDIDLTYGTIKVYGKGNKERIIQICSKEVLSILKDYRALFKPSSHFFINRLGHEISSQSVRLLVKRCVNELNLSKHITPHTFRHTFATLLLEEDVDIKYIQNLLGHSSIVTTQIYTHVNLSKQKKILSNKHPRNKFDFNL